MWTWIMKTTPVKNILIIIGHFGQTLKRMMNDHVDSMKHPDTECRLCGKPGYFIDECLVWIPHTCPDGSMHEQIE